MPFTQDDLLDLEKFLKTATEVVPYINVSRGEAKPGSIAMRHDIDHSIEQAYNFALWEHQRGFKSTYFVLTTAPYYEDKVTLFDHLNSMIALGHEIGFHNDAMCHVDGDPLRASDYIIDERKTIQDGLKHHYSLLGVADHGGAPHDNTEIWEHYPPESFGFEYEAYQLQHSTNTYISDNQGRWRNPLEHAQTFMLVHPTWWPV